jgi:hypothetical protein
MLWTYPIHQLLWSHVPGSHTHNIFLPGAGEASHDLHLTWDLRRRILRVSHPEGLAGPKIGVISKPHVFHYEAIRDPIVLIAGQTKTNTGHRAIRNVETPLSATGQRCGLRSFLEHITAVGRTDEITLFLLAAGSDLFTSMLDVCLQKSDLAVSMSHDELSRPPNSSFDHCKIIRGRKNPHLSREPVFVYLGSIARRLGFDGNGDALEQSIGSRGSPYCVAKI